ncbi:MAG: GPW/gp25 family protein [Flavobacteriia bacterium]|nr:GPW/gp25 family protein [Flavobacteriia bacterium]OJX37516.1 MAG: hypothetical protein BGO87_00715 [Flavobacteriia bacterium 40-80]
MNQKVAFLGTGWSFPPEFSPQLGEVIMSSDEQDIQESLSIILSTKLGERVMLPIFGCNLDDLLFENLDLTTKTLAIERINDAILYYEPRINVLSVSINESRELEGVLLINVDYQIRATNSRMNMVYPFYKIEATER